MSRGPVPEIWVAVNTTWNLQNFRGELLTALVRCGYRVAAYSPPDKYVRDVEQRGVRHVPMRLHGTSTNPVRELAALCGMIAVMGRERPALLVTYTPKVNIYASLAARVWGIPVIANVTGLGRAYVAGGWLRLVARFLYRIALTGAQVVVFQNPEDRDMFVKAGLVKRCKTTLVSGSGVNTAQFLPRINREDRESFVFLMVARVLWFKGVGEFVDAARRLRLEYPRAKFRLVGHLDDKNSSAVPRAQLDEWQREGIVEYLGSTNDMAPVYGQADCVVLPSHGGEGMPRVLLEAASMGIPAVATDVPGCRQAIIDSVTGFLCRPRDSVHLAEVMRRVIQLDDEQRVLMGCAARERAQQEFDHVIVVQRYLDLVREIAGVPDEPQVTTGNGALPGTMS